LIGEETQTREWNARERWSAVSANTMNRTHRERFLLRSGAAQMLLFSFYIDAWIHEPEALHLRHDATAARCALILWIARATCTAGDVVARDPDTPCGGHGEYYAHLQYTRDIYAYATNVQLTNAATS